MSTSQYQVQKLFVEYFGRPADPAGLAYWTNQLEQGTVTVTNISQVFATAAEFTSGFTGLTSAEKVDKVYVDLMGRHAEEPGLVFWAGKLDSGAITLGQLVGLVADALMGNDLEVLTNRVTAAQAFTDALNTAAETSGYNNAGAAALAKAFITSITDDASLAAALATLPETVSDVTGAPVNHAPSGAVTIDGTAVEGQVLSASHTLDDADGLGTVSYQWQAGGVDIAGATGDSFTLTAAQVGKPITVVASYTDGGGAQESVVSNVIASGNDTLNGTAGADTLAGGAGNDTYTVNVAGDLVVEKAGEGTDLVKVALVSGSYTLTANVERATVTSTGAVSLVGNALDNVLTGNAAANTLTGNAGNDTLDGLAGADKLTGGTGNDTYVVDNAGDAVTELANEGTDTVRTALASYTLAANVENLVYTGSGAFSGTGNALDNSISGGGNGSKLDGGAGNDTLQGLGDFADYKITHPTAADTVLTDKAGNVVTVRNVEFFAFADGVRNLAQVQLNVASSGNDKLSGSDDNDTLDGLAGADTLTGGLGDDTYIIDNVGDVIVEQAGEGTDWARVGLTSAGTYKLGDNVEHAVVTGTAAVSLTGNALHNKLTGNGAANTLTGGAGNDTLDGQAGADKLVGGTGDDLYYVDNAGDSITELAGEGTDKVLTTLATYTLANNVENLSYTGSTSFTATGNALDNLINGGDKGNKLDGGAGNDKLVGGLGADSLQGGLGNDTLVAGGGKDTVDGGAGTDLLDSLGDFSNYTVNRPTATDTVLTDKSGNEITVRGVENFNFNGVSMTLAQVQENVSSPTNDALIGTDGNDKLDGGVGADTLSGGLGDDTYVIDNVGDVIVENAGEGTDLAQVGLTAAGTYKLADNVEHAIITGTLASSLTGNALDNKLTGNGAANTLTGGAGNDTLDGGLGADKLIGGTGNDSYVVDNAGDSITELLNEGFDNVSTSLASYTLGSNLENLKYTGTALFTGTGNALDNVITGGDKGNKIDGGAGNDQLTGGLGADSLTGGLGNDIFTATAGKDTIDGGDGSDVLKLSGELADYTITRPSGSDTLLTDGAGNSILVRGVEQFAFSDGSVLLEDLIYNRASSGGDQLYGGNGIDTLDGLAGADTLSGGLGNDTYIIDNVGDTIVENEDEGTDWALVGLTAAGTYKLGDNVEHAIVTGTLATSLTGNALDNTLTGNAAANTLTGGAGNDTLDGQAGADKLIGGLGDDLYVVDNAGDTVTELLNEGTDTVRTALASYTLGNNIENLKYNGTVLFTGTGNALGNEITGGDKGNKLDGAAGDDKLVGGLGADNLIGGLGNDTLVAGSGKDTIDGGDGDDVLQGLGQKADYTVTRNSGTETVLTDKAGNVITVRGVEKFIFDGVEQSLDDVIYNIASSGNDKLYGTDGADSLNGLAGNDTLDGGSGDDIYVVDAAGDVVKELAGGGKDLVQVAVATAGATYQLGSEVENALITSTAAVNVSGNELANILTGNAAANTLTGGAGNDTLDGMAGADKLIGGLGDDLYYVGDSGDTVTEGQNEGYDKVSTTLASYTLGNNLEALVYTGTALFTGTGNALDNELTGGDKGNKLDGGAGNDHLIGGLGNDNLLGGAGDDLLEGHGGQDTIDGGAGNDTVHLSGALADYTITRPNATDTVLTDIAGNVVTLRNVELVHIDGDYSIADLQFNISSPGADYLMGGSGNDLLDGHGGADTLQGLGGDDSYIIRDKATVVIEAEAGGVDTVQVALTAAGTYTLADNVEHGIVTAAAAIAVNLAGNALDNELTGNAAANTLTGGAGNDTLDGGAGADKLIGGLGDDVYIVSDSGDSITELADEGDDTVYTSLASYTLPANVEALIFTGSVKVTGTGNAGDNLLVAGDGGSKLDGGAGNDWLMDGAGNDSLIGGLGDDLFYALQGQDTVDGGAGDDVLGNLDFFENYTVVRINATDTLLTHFGGDSVLVRNIEGFVFAGTEMTLGQVLL
jgi:Ca2+-binding RTX toxin-like protein